MTTLADRFTAETMWTASGTRQNTPEQRGSVSDFQLPKKRFGKGVIINWLDQQFSLALRGWDTNASPVHSYFCLFTSGQHGYRENSSRPIKTPCSC